MAGCARRVDTHAHVIDPARFAFADGVGYRPKPAEAGTIEEFLAQLDAHSIERAVLVQPSCYGYDNAALLDAVSKGNGRIKGIAVLPPTVGAEEIEQLDNAGIIGVRLNLDVFDPEFPRRTESRAFLRLLCEKGWLVQVNAGARQWPEILPLLLDTGVTAIVDHMGQPLLAEGPRHFGFRAVMDLGRHGQAHVKLSAPYRMSRMRNDFTDLRPYVESLLESFGLDRCVWGSDWPFLNARGEVRYEEQIEWLERMIPTQADRCSIFWSNPIALFRFGLE